MLVASSRSRVLPEQSGKLDGCCAYAYRKCVVKLCQVFKNAVIAREVKKWCSLRYKIAHKIAQFLSIALYFNGKSKKCIK
jgi:hypothetical protein